jgi:hypothetical protein
MSTSPQRLTIAIVLALGGVVAIAGPRATDDAARVDALANWRPMQDAKGLRYVGSAVCATCHAREAETYLATPMARATEQVATSEVLLKNPRMEFRNGPYSYRIARDGNRSVYSVSDGTNTITEPILYCFGKGVSGQTFLFEHDGALYESRVSYFTSLRGLDITILHPRSVPASLEDAIGRRMTTDDSRGCFACHTTPAANETQLRLDRHVPGVGCESCHGPGERHIVAVKTKGIEATEIFDPRGMDAFDQTQEFCGACHMSFDKVMTMPGQAGLNNIRFQPYRVFKSQAHFVDDRRLSCVACHDPHDALRHDAGFYDAKCLACHVASVTEAKTPERGASACPVGSTACVACHMPKVDLPEMHAKFTDHWIRVAKPGDPVPR